MELQNYIEGLEQMNKELQLEVHNAISDKWHAERLTKKARALAAQRFCKWHDERDSRRLAQDKIAQTQNILRQTKIVIKAFGSYNAVQAMKRKWESKAVAGK